MRKSILALPALMAGLMFSPAQGATLPAPVESALSKYEGAQLDYEWQDGVLVLDGEVDEALIDKIVVDAARSEEVHTIVNRLYV